MTDIRVDENKQFTIKRYSRLKMETDAVDMDVLLDNDETHQSTFQEQHQRMETVDDDVKKDKRSINIKLGFQILSALLSLLIVVLIILLLVFRSNFMSQLDKAEEKIRQLTQSHQEMNNTPNSDTDNITYLNDTFVSKYDYLVQEIVAVKNHTVTTDEKVNLEGLLLDQSFNIWKIEGLREKLVENKGQILSHVFPIDGYQFSAQVKLQWDRSKDQLGLLLSFKSNNGSESSLPIKAFPLVAYIFEDRSPAEIKRDLIVIGEHFIDSPPLSFDTFGYGHGASLSKVKAEHNRYMVDDTTHIKIVVEDPQHVTNSVQSYNGTLNWTMDNFSVRRQNEIDKYMEYQYSVPFYSGNPGYRMRLIAYAHGDGSFYGDGVTLGMRILTGQWDRDLPKRSTFKTRITIEDQSPNQTKEPITKSSFDVAGKDGGYYIGYIPHYRIKDGVHLVNDTLSIKVAVETVV